MLSPLQGDALVLLPLLHQALPGTVLSPGSEVQLCFKNPIDPEAFPPCLYSLYVLMLLCRKKSSIAECVGRAVQAAPSVWSAWESNSLCFHELSCCMGKQNILLPTVVGCKHMSNGTEELWNSFMYHQILWRIRKPSEYQGVQAHSQVSPFQLCFPPVALRSQISEPQNLLLSPTLTLALLSAMGWVMTVSQFEI